MPLRSTRQRILALNGLKKFSGSTIKQSIRQRIVAIAVGLIILMLVTSVLSIAMVRRVGYLLDELSARYAEPPRVCRRPFGLSYAAMAGCSSMA
jgi:type II secretory pathway component PulL